MVCSRDYTVRFCCERRSDHYFDGSDYPIDQVANEGENSVRLTHLLSQTNDVHSPDGIAIDVSFFIFFPSEPGVRVGFQLFRANHVFVRKCLWVLVCPP